MKYPKPLAGFVDLHTHTTASDGTDSPAKVVAQAHAIGLDTVAITDHDNLSGVAEAKTEGTRLGQEVISGCELAAETPYGEMHIVALWAEPGTPAIEELMALQRSMRNARNKAILHELERVGIYIDEADLAAEAGLGSPKSGGSLGRPHIARALVRKGFARTVNDAFKDYLVPGKPGFVPRKLLLPEEVMRILKQGGATTIFAHPMSLPAPEGWIEAEVARLAELGVLDGIEAYHPEHTEAKVRYVEKLAAKLGLLLSGGSDYHGLVKPKIELGRGEGQLRVPRALLDKIKAYRKTLGLPA